MKAKSIKNVCAAAILSAAWLMSLTACAADPLFIEQDGKFVIEVESVKPADTWEFKSGLTDKNGDKDLGDGYYIAPGTGISGKGKGKLVYKVKIEKSGKYNFRLRNWHKGGPGEQNDCWLAIDPKDNTDYHKAYSGGGSTNEDNWNWFIKNESRQYFAWNLSAGIHEICIMKRSGGFAIDRIHLFREGTPGIEKETHSPTPIEGAVSTIQLNKNFRILPRTTAKRQALFNVQGRLLSKCTVSLLQHSHARQFIVADGHALQEAQKPF